MAAPCRSISAARARWRFWNRSMPFMTTARSLLTVASRPANRSFSASSRFSCGCAAAKLSMDAVACSMGTRRLARTAISLPISSFFCHPVRPSTGGPSHICVAVSVATLRWTHGQSGLGVSAAIAAPASAARSVAARKLTDRIERGASRSVPSPLVGEGQGGGESQTSKVGVPPTPNPSPQGGGESGRRKWGGASRCDCRKRTISLRARRRKPELEGAMSPSSAAGLAQAGEKAFRWLVANDRGAEEQGRAAEQDGERRRLQLAVEREADQLHRMRERVGTADLVKQRARLPYAP